MRKSTWVWIGVLAVLITGGLLYRHFAQEVDSRGATRLMRALEENDTVKTRQLLEKGTDVHARDKSGQTALFYAARYTDDPLMLHKLVAAGADTFAKDKHGYTPLMAAAEQNTSPRVVMALARYGRFLKGQDENKDQALAIAAHSNNAVIIRTLLTTGANPSSAEKNGEKAIDLLLQNPQLSEQEKTDFRHIMLVLEILEARDKFQRANYPVAAEKRTEPVLKHAANPTRTSVPPQEVSPAEILPRQQTSVSVKDEATYPLHVPSAVPESDDTLIKK